jgi:hypothetical protein
MRTSLALAALAAGLATAAFQPTAASAAYCEVGIGQKCYVQSVCATVTAPVHAVDDALGRPLMGVPHCID